MYKICTIIVSFRPQDAALAGGLDQQRERERERERGRERESHTHIERERARGDAGREAESRYFSHVVVALASLVKDLGGRSELI